MTADDQRSAERRWVLSVGAGEEQLPSVRIAQGMGLKVLAMDRDPKAPGLSVADSAYPEDPGDAAMVVKLAKRFGVSAAVPSPLGSLLRVVGTLNSALDLPGIREQGATLSTDKVQQHDALIQAGLPRPRQLVVRSERQLIDAVAQIGSPVVIKPAAGSGSKGVIADPSDLQAVVPGTTMVVEEMVLGRELGVDALVSGGSTRVVLVRDKLLTALPYRQALRMSAPARQSSEERKEIERTLGIACAALGFEDCVVHADVIVRETDGAPVIIETAGRPSGHHICSAMVPAVTDFSPIAWMLERSLNGMPSAPPAVSPRRSAVLAFFDLPVGTVAEVPDPPKELPGLVVWHSPLAVGARTGPVRSVADGLAQGLVIVAGGDLDSVNEAVNDTLDAHAPVVASS